MLFLSKTYNKKVYLILFFLIYLIFNVMALHTDYIWTQISSPTPGQFINPIIHNSPSCYYVVNSVDSHEWIRYFFCTSLCAFKGFWTIMELSGSEGSEVRLWQNLVLRIMNTKTTECHHTCTLSTFHLWCKTTSVPTNHTKNTNTLSLPLLNSSALLMNSY